MEKKKRGKALVSEGPLLDKQGGGKLERGREEKGLNYRLKKKRRA